MPFTTEVLDGPTPQGANASDDTLDIVRQLWPAPHRVGTAGPGLTTRGFAVLPNARRPTRLVPDSGGEASAGALVGTVHGTGAAGHLRRAALWGGARAGLLRLAPNRIAVDEVDGAPSLLSHLGEVFGVPVTASVHLGPPRANRKPVLHVVDSSGRTLGYVKVGINDLTRSLVAGEAVALTRLAAARMDLLKIPRVLHHGVWEGLQVLCLSPLRTGMSRPVPPGTLGQAMVELSTALGTEQTTLARSPHLLALREAVASMTSTHAAALIDGVDRLVDRYGDLTLTMGTWHGDWTPWNMSRHDDLLSLWDWERLQTGVPLGMDALHYAMQGAVRVSGGTPGAVAREQVRARSSTLQPWGHDESTADVVAAVYLLTLGARYAGDGQAVAGARLGRLDTWLLPALDDLLPGTSAGATT